ncbi:MAG: hypothetical protein HY427_01615 [Candidatus Levybacteria bacterium]|nr:hypothetical protein [Candidatus Levybacteria bacterium]
MTLHGGKEGLAPERVRVYPEISLEEEFARQSSLIIARFAKHLGISELDVRALLPSAFPGKPESFNGEEIVPVIIPKFLLPGYKVPSWHKAVYAARLSMSIDLRYGYGRSELTEWKDPRGIVTPNKPYSAWLYVGDDYLNRKPSDVRAELPENRRAGDHWDGLGLAVVRKDIVRAKGFDLIGGQVGHGDVPLVTWWRGHPDFSSHSDQNANPRFRSLVCGKEVEI